MAKQLPSISELIRRTKALAALDLIMSPDWEYRYYSFDALWSNTEGMASMRNGSGDEWWLVFHSDGSAALKGLNHESDAWKKKGEALSTAIQAVLPPELEEFSSEPAFSWEYTSFAYFYLPSNGRWRRANDLTPFSRLDAGEDEVLYHLRGGPADYVSFVKDYYEKKVPLASVSAVFKHQPITRKLVSSLNPKNTLENISDELYGVIDYPR